MKTMFIQRGLRRCDHRLRRTVVLAAALIAGLVALGAVSGCDRLALDGPPTLRAGRDECAECGMLIQDERFATAYLVETRGRRRHVLFDDLSCMLDRRAQLAEEGTIVAGYVRGAEGDSWIALDAAHFVLADREHLRTPMGSGMAAFITREAALDAAAEHCGEVVDLGRLAELRDAVQAARRQGSEGRVDDARQSEAEGVP